jgi:hypothetical protein
MAVTVVHIAEETTDDREQSPRQSQRYSDPMSFDKQASCQWQVPLFGTVLVLYLTPSPSFFSILLFEFFEAVSSIE